MTDNGLSAPGTSVYSSDTMYVGDGTWDSQRNTFLLPNLQGINLATTQYNGMGNRFRNMVGYRGLIKGHGSIAAVTFLFIIPLAIFLARFYHRHPRMALRLHIWLQIMTVLLATVIFILGMQAVGIKRSLTNPHHGIGVALYTLILVQAFAGCIIHRREQGKERFKIPLKLMLHQWVGRLIALLGFVQVALGLTLYGSPRVLFILYAVWGFILLLAYFILTYRNQPVMHSDDHSTYITDRTGRTRSRSRSRNRHGMGRLAALGAAGAGLAAWRRRSRSRSQSRSRAGGHRHKLTSSHHSSHPSDSYVDEKHTENQHRNRTWRERLLGAGAATGGLFAARSLFNRNKHTTTESGSDVSYSRPLGGSEVTQTDLSRVEEGRAPVSPGRDHWRRVEEREAAQAAVMGASPLRQGHRPTTSGTSVDSYDDRSSITGDHHARHTQHHTVRDGIAALGVIGFLRHKMNRRRHREEDERVEALKQQDIEEERLARANSQRKKYTGDGVPPRRNRPPSTILSESDFSASATGAAHSTIPPPPKATSQTHTQTETVAGPSTVPHRQGVTSESGSEAYTSAGEGRHRRHRREGKLAAGAAAAAVSTGSPSRREDSRRRSSRTGSIASPPVSVKVKINNDGRHVTLRRLNEEEAAAEREARRLERERKHRNGSVSSLSNFESNERWRRTEAMEAAQAQNAAPSTIRPIPMPEPVIPPPPPGPPPVSSQSPLPRPPPIPAAAGTVLSSPSGTYAYGTETDVSNYDTNRRRRRAERAQAKQARMGGSRVEFQ